MDPIHPIVPHPPDIAPVTPALDLSRVKREDRPAERHGGKNRARRGEAHGNASAAEPPPVTDADDHDDGDDGRPHVDVMA